MIGSAHRVIEGTRIFISFAAAMHRDDLNNRGEFFCESTPVDPSLPLMIGNMMRISDRVNALRFQFT